MTFSCRRREVSQASERGLKLERCWKGGKGQTIWQGLLHKMVGLQVTRDDAMTRRRYSGSDDVYECLLARRGQASSVDPSSVSYKIMTIRPHTLSFPSQPPCRRLTSLSALPCIPCVWPGSSKPRKQCFTGNKSHPALRFATNRIPGCSQWLACNYTQRPFARNA